MLTDTGGCYSASWGTGQIAPQTTASYSRALVRGRKGKLVAAVTGRTRRLLSLSEVEKASAVRARRHGGLNTVSIDRIRDSEGSYNDLDCDFNPLQDHTAGRWRTIARARGQGKSLPSVDLVRR